MTEIQCNKKTGAMSMA